MTSATRWIEDSSSDSVAAFGTSSFSEVTEVPPAVLARASMAYVRA
jgi:hypothetical protein